MSTDTTTNGAGRDYLAVLLRSLVDARDRQIQKARIAFGNRVDAIERGTDAAEPDQLARLKRWRDRLEAIEEELTAEIADVIDGAAMPIVDHMTQLKGIGPTRAAKLVAMIEIRRAKTVSALWRYAGMGVAPDGRRDRPVKGERLVYNLRLKTACHEIMTGWIRQAGRGIETPYAELYYQRKEWYQANRPDWTPGRIDLAARRIAIKMFLSHLWERWRILEGLPVRRPYAQSVLDHSDDGMIPPERFGWPSISSEPANIREP